MTRVLDRYVVWQFLRMFVGFALAAPMLFVILDITEHVDDLFDRGLTVGQVALSYVYQFPLFVLWAFPVAALIATVFTVNGMTRHSELAAAKAGGVSFFRLFAPIPIASVLLTFLSFGVSELVPIANRQRERVLGERPDEAIGSRSDFVYRAGDGHTYSIRRLDPQTGHIFGVTVEREARGDRPGVHILAQEASYTRGSGWTLRNGYMRFLPAEFGQNGGERTYKFASLRPTGLVETPEQLLARPRDPEDMGYREMGRFIEILERSGARPLKLMVERAQKIAIPVATLIIVLFAMPLAMTSHRGGPAYGVGVSLGITMIYLMLFKIAAAAGAAGTLSPLAAAWLPNALFLVAAVVLLWRVET